MSPHANNSTFKVGVTADFRSPDATLNLEPQALQRLKRIKGVSIELIDVSGGEAVAPDELRRFDSILMKRSPVSAEALKVSGLRCIHIARQGVGLDHLDLGACAEAGVIVTNTPESVRRPMASSAMALILALAHRLVEKMDLVIQDRWSDRQQYRGTGLTGRTLGLVGCGNIGSDILRLAAPWEMERLVFTPSGDSGRIKALGGQSVDLETLLRRSDFVVLCCPLTQSTYRLVDDEKLSWMKRGSFLVNISRGAVVDEQALAGALRSGHLAGAAVDVFDPEPPSGENPLMAMRNVIVTAHNIGLTDEGFRLGNLSAVASIEAVAQGRVPENVTNVQALDHPRVLRELAISSSRSG